MTRPFSAAERRALESSLARGAPLRCPHCDVLMVQQEVERPESVSYVRHRVWVLCPRCKRTAGLDRRPPQ